MPALLDRPVAAQRPYQPYGAAESLLYARDEEVILDGPAGTGKSRACLEKVHLCASKYAGMRALVVRKTRRSLTDTGLVTYEQHVLPEGSPIRSGAARDQRHSYRYPNGSEVVIGGLDDTSKIMSAEYDLIYVQEAREATEADWEDLTTRLRNGVMPYQQIIGDTNPDAPLHWIKARERRGQLRLFASRHEDNPKVTAAYLAKLDNLTGVRLQRLRHGRWVAAEGGIYADVWDSARNLVDPFPIPEFWPRYLAVDFGFTNPFVCQWWAEDPDGRLVRYREVYRTQRLVEDHAHQIRLLHGADPTPRALYADHDAEDRATLERHLVCTCPAVAGVAPLHVSTTAAIKEVSNGIQAVAARLRPAGDGKPRLVLLRDALAERDPLLEERKLPTCTEEEIEAYVWAPKPKALNPDGTALKDEPLKVNDHGVDALRYLVASRDCLDPMYALLAMPAQRMIVHKSSPHGPTPEPATPFGPQFDTEAVKRIKAMFS